MWPIPAGKGCPGRGRRGILTPAALLGGLEDIEPSDTGQTQKDAFCQMPPARGASSGQTRTEQAS